MSVAELEMNARARIHGREGEAERERERESLTLCVDGLVRPMAKACMHVYACMCVCVVCVCGCVCLCVCVRVCDACMHASYSLRPPPHPPFYTHKHTHLPYLCLIALSLHVACRFTRLVEAVSVRASVDCTLVNVRTGNIHKTQTWRMAKRRRRVGVEEKSSVDGAGILTFRVQEAATQTVSIMVCKVKP